MRASALDVVQARAAEMGATLHLVTEECALSSIRRASKSRRSTCGRRCARIEA